MSDEIFSDFSFDMVNSTSYDEVGWNDTLNLNATLYEEFPLDPLEWWEKVIWSILFGTLVIVASLGNIIVIWIVLSQKRMRTVTNYLLVNLSIADASVSTMNVIPNYIYMLTNHWPFGTIYCKIVQFTAVLSICASVFSLMAIAFDRYLAIMYPLRPRMGKRLTLCIAGFIWVGGCILSMPMMIFFTTFERVGPDDQTTIICYAEFPDGPQTESYQEYLYNVFFMIFTYFVPITVMGITYCRVGIELWGSKSIGECTQRQLDNIKSKRRVVKMMIVVLVSFSVAWLPFQIYFIVISLWPELTRYIWTQKIYLGIYFLAMSTCSYNPIIYYWMNQRFRRGFQQVFSTFCPFIHYSEIERNNLTGGNIHTTMAENNRRDHNTTRFSVTGSPEMQNRAKSKNGSTQVHIPLHILTQSTRESGANFGNSGSSGGGRCSSAIAAKRARALRALQSLDEEDIPDINITSQKSLKDYESNKCQQLLLEKSHNKVI